jgi:hypothetical protein
MGTVAHGLAHLIASVGSFSIQLGASPQAAAGGGAAFEADGKGGGQFFVNEGAFPREIGGYSASATDAFVHEMGHGLGEVFPTSSIRGGIGGSMLVQERERAAMSFENACLRESGRERDYYLVPGDYIHPANMDYSHVIP